MMLDLDNKAVVEKVRMLLDVAKAFDALEQDARRAAEGGEVLSDLSAGGRLAQLAKGARDGEAWGGGFEKTNPLAELTPTLEALRGFARWKDDPIPKDAEEVRRYWEAVVFWRNRAMQKEREEWTKCKHLPARRAIAYELAADCRKCSAVARTRADGFALLLDCRAEMEEAQGHSEIAREVREVLASFAHDMRETRNAAVAANANTVRARVEMEQTREAVEQTREAVGLWGKLLARLPGFLRWWKTEDSKPRRRYSAKMLEQVQERVDHGETVWGACEAVLQETDGKSPTKEAVEAFRHQYYERRKV